MAFYPIKKIADYDYLLPVITDYAQQDLFCVGLGFSYRYGLMARIAGDLDNHGRTGHIVCHIGNIVLYGSSETVGHV